MSTVAAYLVTGGLLFIIGLHGLILRRSLLRKILALNIMDSGVFMILLSLAARSAPPDPVPQAMVLTGIVVAVSATALALVLLVLVPSRFTDEHDPNA